MKRKITLDDLVAAFHAAISSTTPENVKERLCAAAFVTRHHVVTHAQTMKKEQGCVLIERLRALALGNALNAPHSLEEIIAEIEQDGVPGVGRALTNLIGNLDWMLGAIALGLGIIPEDELAVEMREVLEVKAEGNTTWFGQTKCSGKCRQDCSKHEVTDVFGSREVH